MDPKTKLQRAIEREEDGEIDFEDYEPDGSGYYVDIEDDDY